ncbi:MAG TPA: PilZ domain-containing protein [Terriglobia bacterium]|nr:PilZ domain-containing protein [Terriglobia bacterium]
MTGDRRQGRRYLVVGTSVISTSEGQFQADLINLGAGGMLAFCDSSPALGEEAEVRLQLQDYPLEVQTRARVLHSAPGLVGLSFLEEAESLEEVLLWLEAGFLACLI